MRFGRLILPSILLGLSLSANARDWTADERSWAIAAAAIGATDYMQTRYIARHPDRFHEINPLMPRHPSLGDVNRHFLVSALVIGSIAHFVPEYRKPALQVYVAIGSVNVARNFHIGLGLSF